MSVGGADDDDVESSNIIATSADGAAAAAVDSETFYSRKLGKFLVDVGSFLSSIGLGSSKHATSTSRLTRRNDEEKTTKVDTSRGEPRATRRSQVKKQTASSSFKRSHRDLKESGSAGSYGSGSTNSSSCSGSSKMIRGNSSGGAYGGHRPQLAIRFTSLMSPHMSSSHVFNDVRDLKEEEVRRPLSDRRTDTCESMSLEKRRVDSTSGERQSTLAKQQTE